MSATQGTGTVGRVDRTQKADLIAVDVGLDLVAEVVVVLDDAGDVESAPGSLGDLDGVGGALVGMDATEREQMFAGFGVDRERAGVDAVVDRGGVSESGVAVAVADRHVVGGRVVALVDGHDPRR